MRSGGRGGKNEDNDDDLLWYCSRSGIFFLASCKSTEAVLVKKRSEPGPSTGAAKWKQRKEGISDGAPSPKSILLSKSFLLLLLWPHFFCIAFA